jgi:hypothetical protein
MVGELADRYKDYSAFSGIDLRLSSWQNPTLNNLESLEWGYEADTVRGFFREAGLVPPSDLDIISNRPAAAKQRHNYLVGRYRAGWIKWRCEKIRDLYRDIVLRIRSARPDLRLSVSIFGERTWTAETMRELGVDIGLLSAIEGLDLIDERLGHGAREADPKWRQTQLADLTSPAALDMSVISKSRPSFVFPMEYIEITRDVAPSSALDLPIPTKRTWASSATEPPGRLALARFATAVGLTDPYMIGDGGNGYVFGYDTETLRAFMNEFRSLPRRPFERVSGVPDAIIARQSEDMFYLVNMLGVPVSARLEMDKSTRIRRTVSGEILAGAEGTLALDLQPYEMAVFSIENGHQLIGVSVSLSKDVEADFDARASAARAFAFRACAGLFKGRACLDSRARSQEIDAAISRANYWTAERLLQSDSVK